MLAFVSNYEKITLSEIQCQPPMSSKMKNRPWAEKPPQTCDTCKLRHQKCTGTRPTCHHCALRGLQCTYSNKQAHKIDAVAVPRKSQASDSSSSSFPSPRRRTEGTGASATSAHDYSVVQEGLMTGLVRNHPFVPNGVLITELLPRAIRD